LAAAWPVENATIATSAVKVVVLPRQRLTPATSAARAGER
jgi:hypothetical protein